LYTLSAADFGDQVSDIIKNTDDSEVEELALMQWIVFPNPTKGNLTVTVQHGQATDLVILDVYGKTILRQNVQNNTGNLQTESLSNGTYFVQLNFANGATSMKPFIKH
jgi:hypothetical protein